MSFTPPKDLVQALRDAASIGFVTHVNPDGDGLGCEAALAEGLATLGKRVAILNADVALPRYDFLGLNRFEAPAGFKPDLLFSLDAPEAARLGGALEKFPGVDVAVLDHHVSERPFGRWAWIEEKAAATALLAEATLVALQVPLSAPMATALYAALAYDTGCFRHSNSDVEAFALAERLLSAGADSQRVNRILFESRSLASVKLWAKALGSMTLLHDAKAGMVGLSESDFKACDAAEEDAEGLAEAIRAIAGVEVGIVARERSNGQVKVSLRSKTDFDVNHLAGHFGGGGHRKASGATLKGPLDQALRDLTKALNDDWTAFNR